MKIASIHRFPVKSLAGEAPAVVELAPSRGILNDRRYAFVPAAAGAPASEPGWRPKTQCVALVRYTGPARLSARYTDATGVLALRADGTELAQGRPEDAADRKRLESAAARILAAEVGTGIALVAAGQGKDGAGAALTDVDAPFVSLVNLASIRTLGGKLGAALDPLRFRANFYFEGAPAWAERSWVGKEITLGSARLEVAQVIRRCAATEVNPATAARDAPVLRGLADHFGHVEMGVYARVVAGGTAGRGASLALA
jgi:uncharacterized protein YcbX